MVRYFYLWTPYVIVGAVVFLALPWLGLIALMVASLVLLPALALAIVVAPYMLVRAIGRRLEGAGQQAAAALRPTPRRETLRKGVPA
jgi:hypothetical protein